MKHLFLLFMIMVWVIVVSLVLWDWYEPNTICKQAGFDYEGGRQATVEKGYIGCCKEVYENHIKVDKICKAVKK